jgi:predicted transcriptional regulator of viral defense system
MRQVALYDELKDREAFRIEDLPDSIRTRPFLAQKLDYLESTGRLRRVRRGAYLVVPSDEVNQPSSVSDPFIAASVLARPYAISFHSALAIKGLAEAASGRIYIQAPKRLQPLEFGGVGFVGVQAKSLFGVETMYRRAAAIQVTDIERTLLDCLRCPQYAGGLEEFLRSIEGVQRYDLLSAVLDWALEHGRPPARLKFRAKFEDLRAEFDQLEQTRLIHTLAGDDVYLTVFGLALCPHSKADSEMEVAKKLYSFLRSQYKVEQGRDHEINKVAASLGVPEAAVQRAAMTFVGSSVGTHITMSPQTGWPSQIKAIEPILDHKDLDQLLASKLAHFKAPQKLSLQNRSLASVRFDRLLEYLKKFADKSLYAKAGFLVTLFRSQWQPPVEVLRELARNTSEKKYYFPTNLKKGTGNLVREWNLIVPANIRTRYAMAKAQAAGGTGASV